MASKQKGMISKMLSSPGVLMFRSSLCRSTSQLGNSPARGCLVAEELTTQNDLVKI